MEPWSCVLFWLFKNWLLIDELLSEKSVFKIEFMIVGSQKFLRIFQLPFDSRLENNRIALVGISNSVSLEFEMFSSNFESVVFFPPFSFI